MKSKHFLDDVDIGRVAAIAFDCFGTLFTISSKQNPYQQLMQLLQDSGRDSHSSDVRTIMTSNCGLVGLLHKFGHPELSNCLADIENNLLAEVSSVRINAMAAPCVLELDRKWYKIGICSNLAKPYAAPVLAALPEEIKAFVWSFEAEAVKPEPAIFQKLCDGLEVKAANVLFVGDSAKNDVEGARNFGMQALHFAPGCGWTFEELAEHMPNRVGWLQKRLKKSNQP